MATIKPRQDDDEHDDWLADTQPLNAQEASRLRQQKPQVSPWQVVCWQAVAGGVVALATWAVTQSASAAWSAAYGALAVVLPAAIFARGLMGRFSSLNPATAVFGFFLWEMVKIALTVAMLVAAPRLVNDLSWPALLVGLVMTMKSVWVAMVARSNKLKPTKE
ncbi:MAG: ATP synthase subunit I [Pseudomonadota bacterium]